MALTDCLATALEGGEISKADHDRIAREFERARGRAKLSSEVSADAEAKAQVLALLKAETAHKKHKAKLALSSIKRLAADLGAHRNARGAPDIGQAALFLLEHNGEAKFADVAGRQGTIVGEAHAMMGALIERFRRSKLAGDKLRKNRAQLPNVVRELFGEETGDAAAKMYAETWSQTAEWLRQRFNAAGGAIGKLEDWGLPQRHDGAALRARGLETWKADIRPLLATDRMMHPLTGTPVAAGELDGILDEIWTGIVTDGWDTREPVRQAFGKGALANQRAEHRFLVFKDGDSWLKYQADYGGGSDPFAAMMGHINMMARDIAAMEVLGPNPQATIEWLKQTVTKHAQLTAAGQPSSFPGTPGGAPDRARRVNARIDAVWGSIRGYLSTPVSGRMSTFFSATRNIITSSVMGAASLTAITDLGTQRITRAFSGIGGSVTRDYIRALTPAGRQDAVSAGLIMDSAMHVFHTQARYIGTLDGSGITGFLADRVLTLSGLTPFTQAGKHAFGLAFFHEAARAAGRNWDQLHPAMRSTFERYGIAAGDWAKIRTARIHKGQTGLTLLRPAEVGKIDPKLAGKWLGMVQRESEYAVPTGGHRSRTLLLDQNQPGTIPGELLRSFAQFKSFGVVYAMLHGARIHRLAVGGEQGKAAAYAGGLLLSSLALGGLALQLKQVASGKDPRPMNTPEFWAASFLQGGGIGLFGDFFFSDLNRYGGGIATSIGGPTAERIGSFANLTVGNLWELMVDGEAHNFGREVIQFARGNVPGGNIWYLRQAWEHMVLDQLQHLVDPAANKSFKTKQQNLKRDYGQGFWWKPGQALPDRAPDLGNAIGAADGNS